MYFLLVSTGTRSELVYFELFISSECLLRGRPKKTWEQSVKCDIRKYVMQRVEPCDQDKWRSCCESNRSTRVSMEKKDVINCLI